MQVSFRFHSLRCSEILVSPSICTKIRTWRFHRRFRIVFLIDQLILGVIYATDGSKGITGMGVVFSNTIPEQADVAGWVEAPAAARPAGQNLRLHT